MVQLSWLRRWTARNPFGSREPRRAAWRIEELEARLLLTTYTPAQINNAYGSDDIMFGSVKGDGTGQTIAIVIAYDAPNIASDLAFFNSTYGLPNTDGTGGTLLTVAKPQGAPAYNAGWAQESTLDVQWAHAIAPGAHILLVEAKSNSFSDLLGAVDYARSQPGVSVVSMSWGSTEFSSETSYDYHFTTPAGHAGVSFVASAGDTGAVTSYPAASPNVLSVGGTTLTTTGSAGTYNGETTWTSSGGGISAYEAKPSYQSSVTQSSTKRTTPDVSLVANPSTGVAVYFTGSNGSGSWYTFGGTSISAPQWAGLVAIVNQGRAIEGLGSLDGRTQLLPAIYNLPASDFHDITQGTAGSGQSALSAGPGYDLVTGRGSPYANLVVPHLVTAGPDGSINLASLTNSPSIGSVSVSAQSGTLTYGTLGSATYVVTVNRAAGTTGAFDVDLSLSGLPSGVTSVFTVGGTTTDVLHFGDADTSLTATLTLSNALKTGAGSSLFTVQAEQLDDNGDPTGDVAVSTGSLAIGKRVLVVSATGQNKVYDGSPAAGVTLSDNRVAGDALTLSFTSATFSNANAGSGKAIAVSGISVSGTAASNYTFNTTASTTATISARPITVTADARSKLAGAADPLLTYQITSGSLVGSDVFSGSLTRAAGETPGTYAIGQGTLSAGGNYALTFVGSTLTIAPIDLAGPWVVNGLLAQINQTGSSLNFVDQNGTPSSGGFAGANQVTGRGGLTGVIDTGTPDFGRIVWSDGAIWLRVSLGGQYFNPANNLLTSITQSGSTITMTTAFSGSSSGSLTSSTTFSIPGFGLVGTIQNGGIQFSNGAFWKKLNLSPTFTAVTGDIVTVQQNGTTNLVFTNRFGGTSNGYWISPTQVVATEFGITGTVANGAINWSNGAVWTKYLTVVGKPLADGAVSIQAANGQFTATNKFGGTSRMQMTAPNTFSLVDFGLTATLSNGTLTFSNGAQWSNFDYNALDALFADISAFPFG